MYHDEQLYDNFDLAEYEEKVVYRSEVADESIDLKKATKEKDKKAKKNWDKKEKAHLSFRIGHLFKFQFTERSCLMLYIRHLYVLYRLVLLWLLLEPLKWRRHLRQAEKKPPPQKPPVPVHKTSSMEVGKL